MKNNKKRISLLLALIITLSLLIQLFSPLTALAFDKVIYIGSADELIDFAESCSYDAWSRGKQVALSSDISLEGIDFKPIATFSGSFDGQGHKISGLDLSDAHSPTGLFSRLEKDGEIKRLTVEGAVSPSGDKGYAGGIVGDSFGKITDCHFIGTVIGSTDIGGIVGMNRISGTISECTVSGDIIGECRTGGIAGSNEGLISSCENSARVNTISLSPSLSLEDINISLTLDITKLTALNNMTMSDTGGIAGYTNGFILGCINRGDIGYPHIGYNVGGIAGRSSGHLSSNQNHGIINGRKDVGGIVGQMEPYVSYNLSEDLLGSLKTELDRLEGAVKDATDSIDGDIPTVSSRFDSILDSLQQATDLIDGIIQDGADYGNDFIGEINRVSEIVSQVISRLASITDVLPELSSDIEGCISEVEKAVNSLKQFASLNEDTLSDIISAVEDISDAFGLIKSSINKINIALGQLNYIVTTNDKDAVSEAIDEISCGLGDFIEAADKFTLAVDGVTSVLDDAPWISDAIESVQDMAEIFSEMSESASVIYDATIEIKNNIQVDWDKISEAGDEITAFVGHLADMTEGLADAVELADLGFKGIEEGLLGIYDSLITKNYAAFDEAVAALEAGLSKIVDSSEAAELSLTEIYEKLADIDGESDPDVVFSNLSASLGDLIESAVEMTSAISEIGNSLIGMIGGLSVDFDGIAEGGSLIIGGVGSIADSIEPIKTAIYSLSYGMSSLELAVNAINQAVKTEDEEKLSEALNSAYTAVGDIINSTISFSQVFKNIADLLDEAALWGEDLIDGVRDVSGAMTEATAALLKIQNGIDDIRNNISFNPEHLTVGFAFIRGGLEDLADASLCIKNAFDHISSALTRINDSSEHLTDAAEAFENAISAVGDAMSHITYVSESAADLIGYLKGVDAVQLPTVPENMTAKANQLFIYISAIESELKYLNSDITALSDELIEILGNINGIFGNIADNIVSMIYSFDDGSIVDSSVSEDEIDSITQGKLFSCTNTGGVSGDINVGGICGAMAIEYTLDPEDDTSGELSITQKKQYKLKAVIHLCTSEGKVSSKYDCAGGIAGKMDLGLIYGCESYCDVESLSGNYVGGIAGISAGLISDCFAKSALYGGKYVGGIIGSGVTEGFAGYSSAVRNCYSMVDIKRCAQYGGAISGVYAGEYSENMFVSDSLAGIDRVSYQGKAEPISYEDLIKRRIIPEEFYFFTLEFIADGELLHSVRFEYGSSFDSSVYPPIPEKDGYYGRWDKDTLENLRFDTTVKVIYNPYVTAVGSEEKRESGREIFFVQGEFLDNDGISLKAECDTHGLELIEALFTKDSLTERWTLFIPKDNLESNKIHFLPQSENCRIFLKIDGIWQEAKTEKFGSYITFEAEDEEIEIAVVEHTVKLLPTIVTASAALVVLAVIIVTIIVLKKKTKNTNKKTEETNA